MMHHDNLSFLLPPGPTSKSPAVLRECYAGPTTCGPDAADPLPHIHGRFLATSSEGNNFISDSNHTMVTNFSVSQHPYPSIHVSIGLVGLFAGFNNMPSTGC